MHHLNIDGQHVPALGLGTWQLRGDDCRQAVEHAIDIGYRHIDTAQAYDNEEQVGQALQNAGLDRDDLWVTTKVARDNLRPAQIETTTEESLRKLRLDHVDLLLVHWPNDDVPLAETMETMQEMLNRGKTRYVGVSNFPPSLVKEASNYATIFCNQVEYHPFLSQQKLCRQARERGYMLTAYCPIARGKVLDDQTMKDIAENHSKSPVQVALRWLLQQPNVAAIPKAASADHRLSNADIFDFELSEDEMQNIHQLAREERICDSDWVNWER